MSATLIFILSLLALYRVVTDITLEDGPFDMLATLRGWLMTHTPAGLHDLYGCPICLSWWLALPTAYGAVVLADQPLLFVPLWWLSLAGGVAALCRVGAS
jgi:hypothetical protein